MLPDIVAKKQITFLIPSRDVVNLISRINLPTRQSSRTDRVIPLPIPIVILDSAFK
jgi:hypothetical protein